MRQTDRQTTTRGIELLWAAKKSNLVRMQMQGLGQVQDLVVQCSSMSTGQYSEVRLATMSGNLGEKGTSFSPYCSCSRYCSCSSSYPFPLSAP